MIIILYDIDFNSMHINSNNQKNKEKQKCIFLTLISIFKISE